MSVDEMKIEVINQVIQLKSEEAVKEIMAHLEQLNLQTSNIINLSANYNIVKSEFGDVLKKLAQ